MTLIDIYQINFTNFQAAGKSNPWKDSYLIIQQSFTSEYIETFMHTHNSQTSRHTFFQEKLFFKESSGGWELSCCLIREGFTWRPRQLWHGYSLSLRLHYDLISHPLLQPVGFAQRILLSICEMTTWHSALSQAKTPALTESGWHVGQRAYETRHRQEGNMNKKITHISGKRKQSLSKHIDWLHRSSRWN